ncbi:hypothetical protein BD289DRAFT_483603 [Coniella lustricola]|uniref:F-box domain-containing protein n=1 Tax=Coniella lustricola TaxID=2025994 RepID=A0A2T3A503_9PEZI|nr:hypothetical protein BD289DRAFT_483603 [Coniella lustricola]
MDDKQDQDTATTAAAEMACLEFVGSVMHGFEVLPSRFRAQLLCELFERMTDDETVTAAHLGNQRRLRIRRTRTGFDIFGALLPELQLHIVGQLSLEDIAYCVDVCRHWRDLFLVHDHIVTFVVRTWFPLHREAANGLCRKPRYLYQALRERRLRRLGYLRSRLTTRLPFELDGQLLAEPLRLQRLHHPHDGIYKDIVCHMPSNRQRIERRNLDICYSNGYLACHTKDSMKPIIVQNLYTMESKLLSLPSQLLIRGVRLKLMTVGNQLVVGASGRILIAWNLTTGVSSQVNLPSTVSACSTRADCVLIETKAGQHQLYVWESLSRLLEIDTTIPSCNVKQFGLQVSNMLDRDRDKCPELPVILHPLDPSRFFLILCCYRFEGSLVVYEFRRTTIRYELSQILSMDRPPGYECEMPSHFGRVDSRGTYELCRFKKRRVDFEDYERNDLPIGTFDGFQSVVFNTLTSTFSVQDYIMPSHPAACSVTAKADEFIACIWEGQSLLTYYDLQRRYSDSWFALLFATDQKLTFSSSSRGWKEMSRTRFWEKMHGLLAGVNHRDLVSSSNTSLVNRIPYRSYEEYGFHWVNCFPTEVLLVPDVLRSPFSVVQSGGHEGPLSGVNMDATAPQVERIWADEDFVVALTCNDTYTIFRTDHDGKWAETIAARLGGTGMDSY